MSLLVVPTRNNPYDVQTSTFEGISYVVSFAFNERCSCWYVSIADAAGIAIYCGVKLVCNMALLRKCADTRKPPGELFCLSSTGDSSPPGLDDLLSGSGRCKLLYITSDWMAAIRQPGGLQALSDAFSQNPQGIITSTYGSVAVGAAAAAAAQQPTAGQGATVIIVQGAPGRTGPPGVGTPGPAGPAGGGTVNMIKFTFGPGATSSVTLMPTGAVLQSLAISIDTVFDAGTLQVGTSGSAGQFLAPGIVDPTVADSFSTLEKSLVGSASAVVVTVAGATSGVGTIVVTYGSTSP